jgi:hypothetical protein
MGVKLAQREGCQNVLLMQVTQVDKWTSTEVDKLIAYALFKMYCLNKFIQGDLT